MLIDGRTVSDASNGISALSVGPDNPCSLKRGHRHQACDRGQRPPDWQADAQAKEFRLPGVACPAYRFEVGQTVVHNVVTSRARGPHINWYAMDYQVTEVSLLSLEEYARISLTQ